jgi:hypothetical protein
VRIWKHFYNIETPVKCEHMMKMSKYGHTVHIYRHDQFLPVAVKTIKI